MEPTKQRLLCVLDILKETDESHPITTNNIVTRLYDNYCISAERKSVLRDIQALKDHGYDILLHSDNKLGYFMSSREFDDWEIKVLCDAVSCSAFLTEHDTEKINKKLCALLSSASGKMITKTSISSQPHNKNNMAKFYIDQIMTAISSQKVITFKYVKTNYNKEKEYKRNGHVYKVSPYSLVRKNDKYYLIGSYFGHQNFSYYKLDRIRDLETTEEKSISLSTITGSDNLSKLEEFVNKSVYNYNGEKITLVLKCPEYMIDSIIDNFGENIYVLNKDTDAEVHIITEDSDGLYYWLMQYGEHITIQSPENVKNTYLKKLGKIYSHYRGE